MFVSRKKAFYADCSAHQREIIIQQVNADVAGGKFIRANFGDRRNFCRRSCDEAFAEIFHLLRHNGTLDNLKPACARQIHHRAPRDTIQKAIWLRRVQNTVIHKKNIGSGRLGDAAAPVKHQRIGIAFAFGGMFRQRTNHIQARRPWHGKARFPVKGGDNRPYQGEYL